jgi:hypothetical protein
MADDKKIYALVPHKSSEFDGLSGRGGCRQVHRTVGAGTSSRHRSEVAGTLVVCNVTLLALLDGDENALKSNRDYGVTASYPRIARYYDLAGIRDDPYGRHLPRLKCWPRRSATSYQNKAVIYDLLFKVSSETMLCDDDVEVRQGEQLGLPRLVLAIPWHDQPSRATSETDIPTKFPAPAPRLGAAQKGYSRRNGEGAGALPERDS